MSQGFPIRLGTHDPRKDIVDTCLKDASGNGDISIQDENGGQVPVNIEYEDYGGDLGDVELPAFLVRQVRGVEDPMSVGWNTFRRTLEFDITFYMVDRDEFNVLEDKKEVQDDLIWHIMNNQGGVTNADNVKVTSIRPVTEFDKKRNLYGFVATLEVIQKD